MERIILEQINNKLANQNRDVDNGSVSLASVSGAAVYADTLPVPIQDTVGKRRGWLWTKAATGTEKLNYYFYAEGSMPVTLAHLRGLSARVSIDNYQTTLSNPFFVIYTKPTGVGDAGAWYHSKISHHIPSTTPIMIGEEVQLYTADKPLNYDSINRLIHCNQTTTVGDALPAEEILTVAIHTDTLAPAGTQILVSQVGLIVNLNNHFIDRIISLVH